MVLGLEKAGLEGMDTMRLTQDDGSISPSRPRHISLTAFQGSAGRPSLAAVHLPQPDVDSRRTSTDTDDGYLCDVILKPGNVKVAVSTEAPDSPLLKKAGGWPTDFQNDDGGVSDTMTGPLSDGSVDDLKKEGYKVCGAEDDALPKGESGKDTPALNDLAGAASSETWRKSDKAGKQGDGQEAPARQPRASATDAKARKLAWKAGVVTVMVRQIPWHWTQLMFVRAVLQRGFKGLFDFIYLPVDIKKGTNVGYGFINFIDPAHAIAFRKAFNHTFLEARSRPQKDPLCVHPASVQGYEANRQHFSKTKTGHKTNPQFSPLYFPGGSWDQVTDPAVLTVARTANEPAAQPEAFPDQYGAPVVQRRGSWDGLVGAPPGVLTPTGPPGAQRAVLPPPPPLGAAMGYAPPGAAQAPMMPGMPVPHVMALVPLHSLGPGGAYHPAGAPSQQALVAQLEEEKALLQMELRGIQEERRRLHAGYGAEVLGIRPEWGAEGVPRWPHF